VNEQHVRLLSIDSIDSFVDQLTDSQAWYVLDRIVYLCRCQSITRHELQTCFIRIQQDYAGQKLTYEKLIDSCQSFARTYSTSLNALHSLENQLIQVVLPMNNNTLKRLPDDIRQRLHDLLHLCRTLSLNWHACDYLFGTTIDYKFYNKLKDMLKTRHFLNRKQSLTPIIHIHQTFRQVSLLYEQTMLFDQQFDTIRQFIHEICPNECIAIENILKQLAELGYLQVRTVHVRFCLFKRKLDRFFTQDVSLVNYLTQRFLSNSIALPLTTDQCQHVRFYLKNLPLTFDLNHVDVRQTIDYLMQLERQDRLDTGTCIEMQNRLNQLARYDKCSTPQMQDIIEKIQVSTGNE
jgi:hypothetical protein